MASTSPKSGTRPDISICKGLLLGKEDHDEKRCSGFHVVTVALPRVRAESVTKKSSTICLFALQGQCRKNGTCPYLHVGGAEIVAKTPEAVARFNTASVPCRFISSSCTKSACTFRHTAIVEDFFTLPGPNLAALCDRLIGAVTLMKSSAAISGPPGREALELGKRLIAALELVEPGSGAPSRTASATSSAH